MMDADGRIFAQPMRKQCTDEQIRTIRYMLPALSDAEIEMLYNEAVRLYRKRLN